MDEPQLKLTTNFIPPLDQPCDGLQHVTTATDDEIEIVWRRKPKQKAVAQPVPKKRPQSRPPQPIVIYSLREQAKGGRRKVLGLKARKKMLAAKLRKVG